MICRLPTNFMLWQEKSVLFNEGRSPPAKNSPWTRYCDRTRQQFFDASQLNLFDF